MGVFRLKEKNTGASKPTTACSFPSTTATVQMGRRGDAAASSAAAAANGDILMLEAPPDALARPWTTPSNAETIDALPYIDEDYGHRAVKDEVDRLVEEEMRRSSKKPSDFLKELPPVPKLKFQVKSPLLAC